MYNRINNEKNKTSSLADWITIITGPITFLSAIVSVFDFPAFLNISAKQLSANEKIGIYMIITIIIFLFLFESSLRLPKILVRNQVTSLSYGFAHFVFHILFLFFFIGLLLIIRERIFNGILPDNGSLSIIFPSIFWVVMGLLVAIIASEIKEQQKRQQNKNIT